MQVDIGMIQNKRREEKTDLAGERMKKESWSCHFRFKEERQMVCCIFAMEWTHEQDLCKSPNTQNDQEISDCSYLEYNNVRLERMD